MAAGVSLRERVEMGWGERNVCESEGEKERVRVTLFVILTLLILEVACHCFFSILFNPWSIWLFEPIA